ncbi:MAG: septum formation protein Maf [Deltaproteobacteria bacterium]|jgi:septum formation protein|nr:septum formation protein Maf [Deltaproteobacteria bacterium]MBT4526905.1 septum formation protein Maf [Deltaproteobacteria bacterium]
MKLKSLSKQKIVLASEAKWRSDILNQLHIPHKCFNHRYDEPRFSGGNLVEFVSNIAVEKALSIQKLFPDHIIIAADQLIELEDEVLGKPGNFERAYAQLSKMNGKVHQLICAVCVIHQNQVFKDVEIAKIKMRYLENQEIINYLNIDQPFNCAGSYKIESLGAALFESVNINDLHTIIGIPGNLLTSILRKLGFSNLL